MKMNLYSIKDSKTGFMHPQVDLNHKSAIRNFELTLATVSGDTIMGFCPEDFDLYFVGEFDNESGLVSPLSAPELIKVGRISYSTVGKEV